ncbi:hypothetical protein [Cohnella nanjingensis]|uniref:hypothetical protein n=1 Tax=Cohnella nanjingensis TaxID=1387779 RepID=UPI001FEB5508|nr:hypothetical protein [Cohnella nanjingensis]
MLQELQGKNASENDQQQVTLEALFPASFMTKHSSFDSFQAFLAKGNFAARSLDEVRNVAGELLDRHVKRETDFEDWQGMLDQANKDYAAR